jgi:FtsP/CotA-like multicopper oxidase with cupredoxin domain
MNRRSLLRNGGLAVAGAFLTASAATPNPASSSASKVTRRTAPDLVEINLEALETRVRLETGDAFLKTYNGLFPGPVLHVREGDTVRLNFTNRLREPTNLHLHGMRLAPDVDAPLLEISPGASRLYEFAVPKGSSGTYWYHPHVHGRVATQMAAGLSGALIVSGPLEVMPELRQAEDHVVVLKDLALVNGVPRRHSMMDAMAGMKGSIFVNGLRTPTIRARSSLVRLRLVNASNARAYRLRLEQHLLHLIASDAGMIERPVALEELLLVPGERAEVLVQLRGAGSFRLENLPYNRGPHDMNGMMGRESAQESLALLTLIAPDDPAPTRLPSSLMPVERLQVDRAVVTRHIVMQESMMPMGFYLNGERFDHHRVDLHGKLGALEVWELENRGDMDHPFHLHTYPFQILERDGVPEVVRAWKDVVNVRRHERVKIAVPLRDFTGLTVYHCHVLEHEDLGMMGLLEVTD